MNAVHGFFYVSLLSLFLGTFLTAAAMNGRTVFHEELIDRGLALYCPQTGEFAFVGECE